MAEETRYQRIAREQRERLEKRERGMSDRSKAASRARHAYNRMGDRARAREQFNPGVSDPLDHDYSMNG